MYKIKIYEYLSFGSFLISYSSPLLFPTPLSPSHLSDLLHFNLIFFFFSATTSFFGFRLSFHLHHQRTFWNVMEITYRDYWGKITGGKDRQKEAITVLGQNPSRASDIERRMSVERKNWVVLRTTARRYILRREFTIVPLSELIVAIDRVPFQEN